MVLRRQGHQQGTRKAIWLPWQPCPYFYKRTFLPQEIVAAEATLAGRRKKRTKGSAPDRRCDLFSRCLR